MERTDRFKVAISTQVDDHSQFYVCETCGAVVPRYMLMLAGYQTMDCAEIHHQWHKRREEERENDQTRVDS